jgi:hypothetical protein
MSENLSEKLRQHGWALTAYDAVLGTFQAHNALGDQLETNVEDLPSGFNVELQPVGYAAQRFIVRNLEDAVSRATHELSALRPVTFEVKDRYEDFASVEANVDGTRYQFQAHLSETGQVAGLTATLEQLTRLAKALGAKERRGECRLESVLGKDLNIAVEAAKARSKARSKGGGMPYGLMR